MTLLIELVRSELVETTKPRGERAFHQSFWNNLEKFSQVLRTFPTVGIDIMASCNHSFDETTTSPARVRPSPDGDIRLACCHQLGCDDVYRNKHKRRRFRIAASGNYGRERDQRCEYDRVQHPRLRRPDYYALFRFARSHATGNDRRLHPARSECQHQHDWG